MKALGLCIAVVLGLSACAGCTSGGTRANTNQNDNTNVVTQYPIESAMLNCSGYNYRHLARI